MDSVNFYVNAWFAQGVACDNLQKYEEAIEAYRQALRLQPEYADAWYNLGIAYGNLKKYGLATLAYEEAVRIEPERASAWFNLGVAYYFQDKREKCGKFTRLCVSLIWLWRMSIPTLYLLNSR
ncbi:MAG: tetratricopeptide repeat protein [Nitrosomonadales bacterium]|nr:tetratricopeptide repeat protein [Nitrosomonadales bacterium]